jgi:hypothetical protein
MDQSKHLDRENRNPTWKRTIKEREVEATAWDLAMKSWSSLPNAAVIRGGRDRQFVERIQYSSPTP